MTPYEESLEALEALFGKDVFFVLATAEEGRPSQRVVDAYYEDGVFWIVTYGKSVKVREIEQNPYVSLCNSFHRFQGRAYRAGHPLRPENSEIRAKLIQVFAPWYFEHNNENDENMCYVKVEPDSGFFHKDGMGYKVDFAAKTAERVPFSPEVIMPVE